ncbi:hypothetical protein CVS40_5763 [Lucilia cuprina]|nr:hypothetical protein CVS40_5763 [Lucilia cuprina]
MSGTGGKYCFAIDRGGTFTDVMCMCPDGRAAPSCAKDVEWGGIDPGVIHQCRHDVL